MTLFEYAVLRVVFAVQEAGGMAGIAAFFFVPWVTAAVMAFLWWRATRRRGGKA